MSRRLRPISRRGGTLWSAFLLSSGGLSTGFLTSEDLWTKSCGDVVLRGEALMTGAGQARP
ncbi:MAG: hypothetical protein RLZZ219_1787 [Cyanobacteriota bacterium]